MQNIDGIVRYFRSTTARVGCKIPMLQKSVSHTRASEQLSHWLIALIFVIRNSEFAIELAHWQIITLTNRPSIRHSEFEIRH